MNHESKVLACVDQSRFSDYVVDYAAWASQRLGSPLGLLHILDRHPEISTSNDHSGTIGVDAQEHLLTALSELDAVRSKQAREQGRIFLNQLRERAIAAGAHNPDVRLRHGELAEILVEQEGDAGLLVLGRRGKSAAATQRDLGRNIERVVRTLHKPILTVTENFHEPQRVMIAFDGGLLTRKGVEMVAGSALFRGLQIHLLMSGKAGKDAKKQLDWARITLENAGFDAQVSLVPGDAEVIIANTIRAQGIDLLIMGAYTHSPLRNLFFGSKTSDLLRAASIPVLLLR